MRTDNELNEIIRTGHGIAQFLKEHGVEHVFGIPDGHTLAFYDGLLQTEGIEHILFNDERSACFAADAYARVTGMLSVCDAGSAGSMNFPIALAEAKGSASPILAIVGTIKSKEALRNIPHDINVEDTLSAITKWTEKIVDSEYLPRFLSYAIKTAITGRPGPVALVIAEDVFSEEKLKLKQFLPTIKGSCSINSCRTSPASPEIAHAIKMIRSAEHPAIFTGGGAILSEASNEIKELSKMLKAPVFTTISGKGIMLDSDDLHFGTVGLFGEEPNHKFLRMRADLVIVVGNRLTEDDTAYFKYPTSRTNMIQIDIDPAEIGLNYDCWGVVGDPKATLFEIINILRNKTKARNFKEAPKTPSQAKEYEQQIMAKRLENIAELKKRHRRYREKDSKMWISSDPIKPQSILKAISDNFGKEDYLVTDASSSSRWIGAYFPVKGIGRKIIAPRGVGPTGFGVGALIGTCIAADYLHGKNNDSKKVLFTGDGGLMNGGLNEFETIKRLGLNCTIIINNNAALGFIKFAQHLLYHQRFYNTDRPSTDFAKVVETFGGKGYNVNKLSQLDSTIKEAINSEGFNLVNILTDPQEYLPPSFY